MQIEDLKKVSVAGGGVLGSQIAYQAAYSGFEVKIWLRSEASIERAQKKLDGLHEVYVNTLEALKTNPAEYAYGLLAKEDISEAKLDELKAKADEAYKNIVLTCDWDEAFADADLVIEAVAENVEQKNEFYTELAKHLNDRAVIVTNSSTLLPSQFAEVSGRPEKYLALHFANHIWKNPTAEVMGHDRTAQENFDLVVAFAAAIRMVPLKVLKEQPGYLLNSMLVPFLSAAEALWANEVGTPEDIDRAWTLGTGAPLGPFRILDVVGLTTAYNIVAMHPEAQKEGTIQNKIARGLKEKLDRGETGVAAGKGFYDYTK